MAKLAHATLDPDGEPVAKLSQGIPQKTSEEIMDRFPWVRLSRKGQTPLLATGILDKGTVMAYISNRYS